MIAVSELRRGLKLDCGLIDNYGDGFVRRWMNLDQTVKTTGLEHHADVDRQ